MKQKLNIRKYKRAITKVAIVVVVLLFSVLFIKKDTIINEFKKMNMDIELLEGGDGIVTMDLHYSDKKKTKEHTLKLESGMMYSNIEMEDITVEGDGKKYEIVEGKETNLQKGVFTYDQNKMNLYWSVDEPGKKEYRISYRVRMLVQSLSDYDVFLYEPINPSSEYPNKVRVSIHTENNTLNTDSVRMWIRGFSGKIKLDGSEIVWKSKGYLNEDSKGSVLLRLDKDLVSSNYVISSEYEEEERSFNYYEKTYRIKEYLKNKEGIEKNTSIPAAEDHSISNVGSWGKIVGSIIILSIIVIVTPHSDEIKKAFKKLTKEDRKEYYEYYFKMPYTGAPEDIYSIMTILKPKKTNYRKYVDYITYYILKWTKVGILKEYGLAVVIVEELKSGGKRELELFSILKKSAGNSRIDSKKLKSWLRNNLEEVTNWQYNLDMDSKKMLVDGECFKVNNYEPILPNTMIKLTEKGELLRRRLIEFENYLLEFSHYNTGKYLGAEKLDRCILNAALYGNIDKVLEEIEKVDSSYLQKTKLSRNIINIATDMASQFNKKHWK